MSLIVGIDPATSCGWAVLDRATGARVGSGCWDLSSRRHEGGGMRYLRARAHLVELLDAHPIEAVGYEEVARHAGVSAAHVYGGIVAMVSSVCEERRIAYAGQPVGSVKKLATGKGNAGKEAMVEAALAKWPGLRPDVSDDEADALWVAEALRVSLGGGK
jgi:Holliday junction resolvasome RuvABC endonuclease subunit